MILWRAIAFVTAPLSWRSAVVLAAGLAAAAQLVAPTEPTVSGPPPIAPAAAPSLTNRPVVRGLPNYPDIAGHPLFYPTRQPWAPPAVPVSSGPPAPAPKELPPLQNYQLSGVVISAERRIAVLKAKDGGKTVMIAEGQDLDGWKLRRITRDAAHFTAGGSVYDLKFPSPRWPHD